MPVKVVVTPVTVRCVAPLAPENSDATSVTFEPATSALLSGCPSARTRRTVTEPGCATEKLAPV